MPVYSTDSTIARASHAHSPFIHIINHIDINIAACATAQRSLTHTHTLSLIMYTEQSIDDLSPSPSSYLSLVEYQGNEQKVRERVERQEHGDDGNAPRERWRFSGDQLYPVDGRQPFDQEREEG